MKVRLGTDCKYIYIHSTIVRDKMVNEYYSHTWQKHENLIHKITHNPNAFRVSIPIMNRLAALEPHVTSATVTASLKLIHSEYE